MSLTNNTRLRSVSVNGDFPATIAAAVVAEASEAIALTTSADTATLESGDWAYSAIAENRTGEVPVDGFDMDVEPGLIYTGPAGGAVRVKVANLDVTEGAIIADPADSVTAALFVNNNLVAYADEGFVAELDITAEFNFDTYVGGLQSGDVLRVALVGGTEETLDLDVAEGGTIDVV